MMGYSVPARSLDFIGFRCCSRVYSVFQQVLFYLVYPYLVLFLWCHGAKIGAAKRMAPQDRTNGRNHT